MLSRIGDRSDGSAAARVQGESKPGEVRATRGFSKRKSRQDHNFRHRAPANHKLVNFCPRQGGWAEFVGRHSITKEASTTPTTWFFLQGNYLQHRHSSIPCNLCLELSRHLAKPSTLIQSKTGPTTSTTVASS